MVIGPAVAIPAILDQCQLTGKDINVFEINEAFALQATWWGHCLGTSFGMQRGAVNSNLVAQIAPTKSMLYGVISM
jgi:acetyl-CoA acetyltransferase